MCIRDRPKGADEASLARLDAVRHAKGGERSGAIRLAMQKTMQRHAAVFREGALLDEGCQKLGDIAGGLRDLGVTDRSKVWNSEVVEAIELQNLMVQAVATMHSAANREESRGAHARDDFKERDDVNWLKHTLSWVGDDHRPRLGDRAVHLHTLSNDVEPVPLMKRVY